MMLPHPNWAKEKVTGGWKYTPTDKVRVVTSVHVPPKPPSALSRHLMVVDIWLYEPGFD
jgi:hypothetical protein